MRDTLIILGICIAAFVVGGYLYINNVGPTATAIPELGATAETPEPVIESVGPVTFSVLSQGTRASGISDRKNFAVRSELAFEDLWQKVHGEDGEALPKVAFDQYQVIGVFAGIKSSGGYAISVISVQDSATERMVTIAITSPGEGCSVTQALTNPYQLIKLPASNLPLTREYVEEIRPCS